MAKKEKQFSIHLTMLKRLHNAVKKRAFTERLSIVALTRKALRRYLGAMKEAESFIPKGFFPVEAYMNDEGKYVLFGNPKHDPDHDCDLRGCSSVGEHVILHTDITRLRQAESSISEA